MTSDDAVATAPNCHAEIQRLAAAVRQGQLDARADATGFQGQDATTVTAVNEMLDALVVPLRVAAGAIDELARGRIPRFLLDEQVGQDNELKRNLNTLLATLYGMHHETRHLVANIRLGKLHYRGNDWDYEGIWRELIAGVNSALDAVIAPVSEASSILGRLAGYDLAARMRGRYRGDHAEIKKAMNLTAESLHSAIAHVAETVTVVSVVGADISQSSQAMSEGAAEQERQIAQATEQLELISETSSQATVSVHEAQRNAREAAEVIARSKDAMAQMLTTMGEIVSSADNTATIIQTIDAIAKETDTLSSSASEKARTVRSSASGFSVVAGTIGDLSERCEAAVHALGRLRRGQQALDEDDADDAADDELKGILKNLREVTNITELLGLNAAIEAAHVEGAGFDFAALTEEIRTLAQRSADATRRTEQLIQTSISLAHKGKSLAEVIDKLLVDAVNSAAAIGRITDRISKASDEQAAAVGQISQATSRINDVTHRNAASARASSADAVDLEGHVQKLAAMVEKFRLEAAS